MKHELHPNQAALSRALYVIRLRHPDRIIAGRWRRTNVAARRQQIEREWDRGVGPKPKWYPQPWQPDHGRESPREDWMNWRRFGDAYSYPGCVGAKRKMLAADATRNQHRWGTYEAPRRLFTVESRSQLGLRSAA